MKIIISHDVDHLTLREHFFKDLIIPKHFIRSYIEYATSRISFKELLYRHYDFFTNKWNRVEEISKYNNSKDIKCTFFFGVENGLGLSYNYLKTEPLIQFVIKNGHEVGIHGISYDNYDKMLHEFQKFKNISGLNKFGIRMHYLRKNTQTLDYLNDLGYLYDSTYTNFESTSLHKNLIEFPVHLMEGWVLMDNKKLHVRDMNLAKNKTIEIINKAIDLNVDYFSLLFHDFYFSNRFEKSKEWYIWVIDYLKSQNFEFITYSEAINHKNINKQN